MTQLNPKTGLPFRKTQKQRDYARQHRISYKQTTIGRATVLVNNARSRAVKKNIKIDLPIEWVKYHLDIGVCQITGLPFNLEPPPKGVSRRYDAPSLDRIDKTKDYTSDNTRVILWAVNCALSEYGTDVILPILKATVLGIENAKKNTIASIPEGSNRQSEDDVQPRIIFAPWLG